MISGFNFESWLKKEVKIQFRITGNLFTVIMEGYNDNGIFFTDRCDKMMNFVPFSNIQFIEEVKL